MFKKYFFPVLVTFFISLFFYTATPVEAQVCGYKTITYDTGGCTSPSVCNEQKTSSLFTCTAGGTGGCYANVFFLGTSCEVTPGTQSCTCSKGGSSCSSAGATCGTATTSCTCSEGGACSGNGSACGTYGTCNCTTIPAGTCNCITSGVSCTNKTTSSSGMVSCGGGCTWGGWSACSATCGPGTQTRTSSCGQTQTQACNLGACCGNGTCNAAGGETCSTCSSDCGVCSPPTGGNPPPYCGNGSCNVNENCSNCARDCGACTPTCTPTCTTACGQNNGCGGTCGNTDAGIPAVPTNLVPPNGTTLAATGTVNLGWDRVAKADLYEVQVYPTGTAAGQECIGANKRCPAPSSANAYSFTPDAGVTSYTWRVRAINTTCGSSQASAWTSPSIITLGGGISGNFYIDTTGTASYGGNGLCQSGTATLGAPPAGTTITAYVGGNSYTGSFTGGTYNIPNVNYDPGTNILANLPAGYRCTCPAGCNYSGVTAGTANVNYYFTNTPLGWWTSSNGYVFGGTSNGPTVTSKIPQSCETNGTCVAAMSQYDSTNTANSDGSILTGGGSIDSTEDLASQYSFINESRSNTYAQGMKLNGPREDYTYFAQQYGIGVGNTVDFTGNQPTVAPVNNGAYFANGDVTITNQWTVNTADSYVVFVNGNLTIRNQIRVAKGGFVAFIVKGNITIDKAVGSNSSNNPVIAGVFIADNKIISQSNAPGDDLKLVAEGTFVGWNGIQLLRNFNNGNASRGATEPIEVFNFRPDFLLTVPDKMTKPLYLWQETN